MKFRKIAITVLAFGVLAGRAIAQSASPFESANRLYDQGNFAEAASAYQNLIKEGTNSSAVFFNLGNALFKSGQIGRALAVYRTLEASMPRDPDLRANLRFALAQVKGPSVKPRPLEAWLRRLTIDEWTLLTAAGFWAALLLLAAGHVRTNFRRPLRSWVLATAVISIISGVCLAFSLFQLSKPKAIVIVPEAAVRQAPLDDSPAVLTVSDGAELLVLDRNNDWLQVTADQQRSGWMKADQALSAR